MKRLSIFVFAICVSLVSFAQKEVSAKSIFEAIDKKQQIQYDGVVVVGTLDLTELSNKKRKNNKASWDEYKSTVEVPVVFRNCTFKGDVIAYKNLSKDGKRKNIAGFNIELGESSTTYSTDFPENVVFENCTFEGDSEFKYSNFARVANFSGTKFSQQANFKYAHFKGEASFSGNQFSEYANFKYADFDDQVYFKNARFRDYADFKYAHFHDGVSFKSGRFQRHADFKYTNFSNDTDFQSTDFEGSTDFKYSNGKRYVSR